MNTSTPNASGNVVKPDVKGDRPLASWRKSGDTEQGPQKPTEGHQSNRGAVTKEAVLEQAKRSSNGSRTRKFDHHEGGKERNSGQCRGHDDRRTPPPRRTLAHGVEHERQPAAREDETGDVEPPRGGMRLVAQEQQAKDQGDRADRQIDEEHPTPRGMLDQRATDDRAERWRHGGRNYKDLRGAGPLCGRKARNTIAIPTGWSMPPPTPWITRAPTRAPRDGANAAEH